MDFVAYVSCATASLPARNLLRGCKRPRNSDNTQETPWPWLHRLWHSSPRL